MMPADIDNLTMSEIAMILEVPGPMGDPDAAKKPPMGTPSMTPGEMEEELQRWHSLTPKQRLREAKERRDR